MKQHWPNQFIVATVLTKSKRLHTKTKRLPTIYSLFVAIILYNKKTEHIPVSTTTMTGNIVTIFSLHKGYTGIWSCQTKKQIFFNAAYTHETKSAC